MKRRGSELAEDAIVVDGHRVPRMILFGLHDPRWDPDPDEEFNVRFDRYVFTVGDWLRSNGLDWDQLHELRRRGLPWRCRRSARSRPTRHNRATMSSWLTS